MVKILKSIWSVLAGFILVALLSVGTDMLMVALGIMPNPYQGGQAQVFYGDSSILMLALLYRTLYSALGSYVTAKLAPFSPWKHVAAGAVIGLAISTLGAVYGQNLGPSWYAWGLVVAVLPTAWLGGKLFYISHPRA